MDKKVFCEQCDTKVNYYYDMEEVTMEVKDLEITLNVQVPKCIKCKSEVFAVKEDSTSQDLFFDEYKRTKGLVSKSDIELIRKNLKISQRDLSRLLGLGEITITRYELGSIPSKANSMMIESLNERSTVKKYYTQNYDLITKKGQLSIQLYLENTDPIKYTGNRQYSIIKFSQLTAYIINLFNNNDEKVYITKLNKLLFYVDFNFFRKFGVSITGSKYIKMSYGPVPSKFDYKYDMNPLLITNQSDENIYYDLIKDIEYTELSDEEQTIAQAVYKRFIGFNGKYISNASHMEEAWLETEKGKEISYDLSKNLKITV